MPLADFDLTDLDAFANGFPHEIFVVHRREAPVYWHAPTAHTPGGEGFWSVATHAESLAVLNDAATYSSERGGVRPYGGTILPDSPIAGQVLNMMDGPRHHRVRQLVSRGLTPRTIARLGDELRSRTRALLDVAARAAECDFVTDVAAELPMQAICILLGVPERDRHRLFKWTDRCFDFREGEAFAETDEFRVAMGQLWSYGTDLIAEKRARPTDDMLSIVTHATLPDEDPPHLTLPELQLFFSLLFAAGSDTTRNSIAGGLLALLQHPGELARLERESGLLGTTIEEMVRWTSPAAYNRRTATCATVLGGRRIRAGDKVVFWEASANRDERVFADAMRFRVGREPNPHLGFGHGVHHCLGANLARLELCVVYEELLARFGRFELAGAPEWTRSNKHTGLRHLPVRMHARR
ncbi:MAG: cytochrome P450 [Candidatus Binatia bacterium]